MEQSSSHRSLRYAQQQQSSSQGQYEPLPPPSSLSNHPFRTNTLPPLNAASLSPSASSSPTNVSNASSSARGYPPPTYSHPSLSTAAQLPASLASPLSMNMNVGSWGRRDSHDFGSSASGISPPLRHVDSRGSLKDEAMRESYSDREDRERERDRDRGRDRERERERDRDREVQRDREQREGNIKHEGEDGMPSTSDFVKKLYKMLEDPSFQPVVSWGPHGDCFVVKDMNEFTKSILPRMFKHSNFASFVRQLNKYDFHKVKNTDDNTYGEHSWTFRHPDFHADRRDALENIKRKVPAARKSTGGRGGQSPSPSSSADISALSSSLLATQSQVALIQSQISSCTSSISAISSTQQSYSSLASSVSNLNQLSTNVDRLLRAHEDVVRAQEEMASHIRNLENNYQNVLNEMVMFQRNMAQQDGLMQNLIQYFLQVENGKLKAEDPSNPTAGPSGPSQPSAQTQVQSPGHPQAQQVPQAQGPFGSDPNPFLPVTEAQRMMGGTYPDDVIARASLAQMNEISRRAESAGMSFSQSIPQPRDGPSGSGQGRPEGPPSASKIFAAAANLMPERPLSRQDALARIEELSRARPTSAQGQIGMSGSGSNNNTLEALAAASANAANAATSNAPAVYADVADPYAALLAGPSTLDDRYGVPVNSTALSHEGLQVFTVGHLMPKSTLDDENGNWSFDPNVIQQLNAAVVMPTPQGMGGDPPQEGEDQRQQPILLPEASPSPAPSPRMSTSTITGGTVGAGSSQKLRVRRSTYVPGWAVPPRVLLVDDDAISRKLSSKFLQVFGCAIDVAVDGVSAVNKMNLEKYDLVLMDIVMPKLDGVSATSLIRQFDHMTPIISMTSNSKPNEIIKYYSSGMNDILPKPFTKDGLLEMLEKHLMHLKVIQTMQKIPRSVGVPPLSDASFDQALSIQTSNALATAAQASTSSGVFSLGDEDGKINPLAGMGLTDEQYSMILQNLVNGESFMGMTMGMGLVDGSLGEKRGLDDSDDGRDGKRGRFEVIE